MNVWCWEISVQSEKYYDVVDAADSPTILGVGGETGATSNSLFIQVHGYHLCLPGSK